MDENNNITPEETNETPKSAFDAPTGNADTNTVVSNDNDSTVAETKADTPVESTVETPVEATVETTVETPAEATVETTVETPVSTPATTKSAFDNTDTTNASTNTSSNASSTNTYSSANSYYNTVDNSTIASGKEATSAGFGIASLVLGIISIPSSCCCGAGILFSILGLIFGIIQPKDEFGNKPGVATAGIIISCITIVLSIIVIFIFTAPAIISDYM